MIFNKYFIFQDAWRTFSKARKRGSGQDDDLLRTPPLAVASKSLAIPSLVTALKTMNTAAASSIVADVHPLVPAQAKTVTSSNAPKKVLGAGIKDITHIPAVVAMSNPVITIEEVKENPSQGKRMSNNNNNKTDVIIENENEDDEPLFTKVNTIKSIAETADDQHKEISSDSKRPQTVAENRNNSNIKPLLRPHTAAETNSLQRKDELSANDNKKDIPLGSSNGNLNIQLQNKLLPHAKVQITNRPNGKSTTGPKASKSTPELTSVTHKVDDKNYYKKMQGRHKETNNNIELESKPGTIIQQQPSKTKVKQESQV